MIDLHTDPDDRLVGQELREFWEDLGAMIDAMMDYPDEKLGAELFTLHRALGASVQMQHSPRKILKILDTLITAGIANFQYALSPEDGIDVTINGNSYYVAGEGTTHHLDVDTWATILEAATIRRNQEAIDKLLAIPESVIQNAAIAPDDFDWPWYQLMRGLHDPEAKLGGLLIKAMRASIAHNDARPEFIDKIRYPQINLLKSFHAGDEEGFNEALEEAVNLHKNYWKSENETDAIGWISLSLLAVCAMAIDQKGMNITFRSDYLPLWLMKGQFGESTA